MIPFINRTKSSGLRKSYHQLILCTFVLTILITACSSTVDVLPTTDNVQAVTQTEPESTTAVLTPTAHATLPPTMTLPSVEESILPQPLYFGTAKTISRLEPDGVTLSTLVTESDATIDHWQLSTIDNILYYQIGEKIIRVDTTSLATTEIVADAMPLDFSPSWRRIANRFDLSPNNESLAYVNRENKLIVTDVDGQNKTVWVNGDPPPSYLIKEVGEELTPYPGLTVWEYKQQIYNPLWSPTGEQIAFGQGGVNVLTDAGTQPRRLATNAYASDYEIEYEGQEPSYPGNIGQPKSWSPDGSKLLFQDEILTADISEYGLFIEDLNNEIQTPLTLPIINDIPISAGTAEGFLDLWSQDSAYLYIWSFGNQLYGDTVFLRYNTLSNVPADLLTDASNVPYTLTDAPFEIDSGQMYLFVDSRPEFIWASAPRLYMLHQTTPEFLDTANVEELVNVRSDVVAFDHQPGNYSWAPDGQGVAILQLIYGEQDGDQPYWPVTDSKWLWMSLDPTQELVQLPLPTETLQLAWGSN